MQLIRLRLAFYGVYYLFFTDIGYFMTFCYIKNASRRVLKLHLHSGGFGAEDKYNKMFTMH